VAEAADPAALASSAEQAIAQRLDRLRRAIAAACARVGRDPSGVVLIGASKRQPPSALRAAHAAGLAVFGENRVQEALEKQPQLPPTIEWHLIGPLQSNKAALAARHFAAFHAVDRPKIAEALDRELAALGRRLPVFVEVNLGGETSKHGFSTAGLLDVLAPLARLAHLEWRGLMAIPPPGRDAEASRPWFRQLARLRDEVAAARVLPGFGGQLSMGMSDDFTVAVEEGATHVRVGTALFGPRPTTA
jgi:pyridoxal phosphate enzyme (YggS family)